MINAELLSVLACPCCKGELKIEGDTGKPEGLACKACALVYPIEGDIPIMLKEEAVPAQEWTFGTRKRKG